MSDIFGTSNFGGNYTKKTFFKLKDGELSFRILPPIGALAAEGKWSVFWKVHYGYKNSAGQLRVFESPLVKNNKSKMIEVPDAALERIEDWKAKLEAAKKSGNTAEVVALDKLVGQKGAFNLDSNHYLNVIDESGKIGILKIRHRAKVALDAEIKRLREKGVDPLSPNDGRYFTFRRSGMGLDTTFSVSVKQETVDVPGFGPMQRDIVHKLTAEIAGRCASKNSDGSFRYVEAANLSTLYKKPNAEQVARIVKEGARAVDEILDAKTGEEHVQEEDGHDEPSTAQASAPVAAVAVDAAAAQLAALQAQIAALTATQAPVASTPAFQAPVTQAPVQAPVAAAPVSTPATETSAQSEQDFLKSLGL